MNRLMALIIWLAVILVIALALPHDAGADWTWTPDQQRVIDKIYYWSDWYGADTALMLRIAYRETRFGLARVGDGGHSVGIYQWYDGGLWPVTPCYYELGWAGRWNEDADIRCAAWAFRNGYAAHWRPWEWPPYSWLEWLPAPSPRMPPLGLGPRGRWSEGSWGWD